MNGAIGGYFELELRSGERYHKDALCLNTARNCFEYILLARKYKKVYIPYYTCDVMLQPFHKHHVEYEFYSIDFNLEPTEIKQLQKDEAFLYTNYFGLKQNCVERLASIYHTQLIVDNSQAFFFFCLDGIDTFYSPRKFFGVPDGGYLYTNCKLDNIFPQDKSYDRMKHLLLRIDDGAEAGYASFKDNDSSLDNMPIMEMSRLTKKILSGINYDDAKKKRLGNFLVLHDSLKELNPLSFHLSANNIPMVYPFYCEDSLMRKHLIENKVFVAQYWPNLLEWCKPEDVEYDLCLHILPLPIDQRYNEDDMDKVIHLINTKNGREDIFKSLGGRGL